MNMAKIIIDTNEFIDLIKLDKEEIKTYIDYINQNISCYIFPQQVIDETLRHISIERKRNLSDMTQKYTFYNTNSCKLLENKSKYVRQINEINKQLSLQKEKDINLFNEKCNLLFDFVKNIPNSNIIPTTQKVITNALNRKTCGNPPSSNSRVGDEIIWESILTWKKDNIVIISNDHTFHENKEFLDYEYNKLTGKNLLGVYDKLDRAREFVDLSHNEEIIKIELKEEKLSQLENRKALTKLLGSSSFLDSVIKQCEKLNNFNNIINPNLLGLNDPILNIKTSSDIIKDSFVQNLEIPNLYDNSSVNEILNICKYPDGNYLPNIIEPIELKTPKDLEEN